MTDPISTADHKEKAAKWFETLRNEICNSFEAIEEDNEGPLASKAPGKFERKSWQRENQDDGMEGARIGSAFQTASVITLGAPATVELETSK